MVVCFTCSVETKVALDRLVAAGDYQDHSEAIAIAIQNLAVIHSELKDARSIVIDRHALVLQRDPGPLSQGPSTSAEPGHTPPPPRRSNEDPAPAGQSVGDTLLPALFLQLRELAKPALFASFDSAPILSSETVHIENWIFGQYNRLLPAKVTCRAVANLSAQGAERQPLEKLAMCIATDAARLGQHLVALDEKRKLGRDDSVAIAFPKNPAQSEIKSIQRFANQFVGFAGRDGHILGLPAALGLIGPHPQYPKGVALTEFGWKFGTMHNPLLDSPSGGNANKFSNEEVCLLVDHILTAVPREAFAYKTILEEIARGFLTPDALDAALAELSAQGKKPGDPFVSTQRSGAICRMVDLELLARSRTATRVSYVLTSRGVEFLRKSGKTTQSEASKSINRP